MKGGKGADSFYWGFEFSVSFGKKQADRVTFKAGQGDQIVLDADAFGGFGVSLHLRLRPTEGVAPASETGADLVILRPKGFCALIRMKVNKALAMAVSLLC